MKDIVCMLIWCLSLTSVFGMAAFLMYNGVAGWGWFLLVMVLIFGTVSWKVS